MNGGWPQVYAALMALAARVLWSAQRNEGPVERLQQYRLVLHQQTTLQRFARSLRRRLKVTNGPREFSNRHLPLYNPG